MGQDEERAAYRGLIFVWLKSTYFDAENFFRLGGSRPDYDGASWPLGISLRREAADVGNPLAAIDADFDQHVKNAWQLPWQLSGIRVDTPFRRNGANFVIRQVGGGERSIQELTSGLINRRSSDVGQTPSMVCAATPFCIVVQHQLDYVVHTEILLFYTYETFIQECLVLDALRQGVSADEIALAFEHNYSNAHPYDCIPTDPRQFKLAQLANSSADWDEVYTTADSAHRESRSEGAPGSGLRSARRSLFYLRLETHLMVAIAAAICGLKGFSEQSPLVVPFASLPVIDEFSLPWLGHVLGKYDHANECVRLLIELVRKCGRQPPTEDQIRRGFRRPQTQAENSIVSSMLPGTDPRHGSARHDFFRWDLFDTSLDDHSVGGWRGKLAEFTRP